MIHLRLIFIVLNILIIAFGFTNCTLCSPQKALYFHSGNTQNPSSEWFLHGQGMVDMEIDNSSSVDGHAPLKLICPTESVFGEEITFILSTSLCRSILLPERSATAEPIHVKLHYKSQYIDTVQMIVTSLTEQEDVLQIDTLALTENTPWTWLSYTLADNSSRLLNIEIRVVGNDPNKNPAFWLDRIELSQAEQPIAPAQFSSHKPQIQKEEITLFSPFHSENFNTVSSTINKPIVAVGEWLHGSETLEETAIEFLKYRIQHHNTKLVLIELPLEIMLSVNRFVTGDEAFQIDSIWQDFDYYLYSEPTRQFMIWLKEYNQNSSEKVSFLGTEINIEFLVGELQLHDFFCRLSAQYPQNEKLKFFVREVLSFTSDYFVEVAKLFQKNDCFSDILTPQERAIIQFYFESGAQLKDQNMPQFLGRDKQMFKNCTFLFDLFSIDSARTASLYTHISHASYQYLQLEFPQLKSMGQMLKEHYSNAYSCIGLHALGGEFLTFNNKNPQCEIKALKTYKNSLEQALIKEYEDDFFISTQNLNQLLLVSTYGASENNKKSTLMNPYARMDGIIFIKESTPKRPKLLLEPFKTSSQRSLEKYEKKLNIFRKKITYKLHK